jgi:hypothetical protein
MDPSDKPTTDAKASRKDRALVALLEHASVSKAAAVVGVHETTLRRWMKDTAFQRKLFDAQAEKFSQSMRCLQQAAPAAAAGLVRTMKDPATPDHLRVRAMEIILKVCQGTLQHEYLNARLAEMQHPETNKKPSQGPDNNRNSKLHVVLPLLLFLFLPLLRWLAPGTALSFEQASDSFRMVGMQAGRKTAGAYGPSQGAINDAVAPDPQPAMSDIRVVGVGKLPAIQFLEPANGLLRVSSAATSFLTSVQPACARRTGRSVGCNRVTDEVADRYRPNGGPHNFSGRAKPSISVHQAAGFAGP